MFKKISAEEFENLNIKGWGRSSPTYNAILNLQAGEVVIILKSQWRRNKAPSSVCRQIEKKFPQKKLSYKCVALADDSGWAIKRLT